MDSEVSRPAPTRGLVALVAAAIALTTFAVYGQVSRHAFVNYDSHVYVYENEVVQRGLTLEGVRWAFTTTAAANWHPVTWLSILVDCELFGVDPGAHHLMAVAYHVAGALLLLAVLLRGTGSLVLGGVAAALFALHPQHVEAVAWASQRKDVLSTLLLFATVFVWLGHLRAPSRWSHGAALLLFALGLMAKPMLVTLPVLLLLLDHWPLGRTRQHALAQLAREKLGFFGLAAASAAVTLYAQSSEGAVGTFQRYPVGLRLENSVVAVVRYLAQTLWPSGLGVFYPYPQEIPLWQWGGALGLLALATAFVVRTRWSRPELLFGWGWFLVALVPVIGWVQVGKQALADRYTYVPHVGLFVLVGWGLDELLRRQPHRRAPIAGAVAVAFALLAFVTLRQVGTWRDSESLYRRALAVTERNATMEFNLGVTLSELGRGAEAAPHLANALRFEPGYPRGAYTYGVVLASVGRTEEALAAFEVAVRLEPDDFDAHSNLAALLYGRDDFEGAERHFAEAVRVRGSEPMAITNLALARMRLERFDEAAAGARAVLDVRPGDPRATAVLGESLFGLGRLAEARPYLERAVRNAPEDAALRRMLAACGG